MEEISLLNHQFIQCLIQAIIDGITEKLNFQKEPERWVDEETAQKLLGLKRSSVAKLRMSNMLLFSKSGGRNILYCRLSIEKFLLKNSNQAYYGN